MCGVGRDGPFRQNKTEVHYEQHRNVGDHRSCRVLRHLRHLGMLQVLGPPPSRVCDLNEAEIAVSWRGVLTPRASFSPTSRRGVTTKRNGFVGIAVGNAQWVNCGA